MQFERAIVEHSIVEWPGDAGIRAELERVVAGPRLIKSPQLVKFLRFVVEAVLTGKGRRIKAYTVAIEALGRDPRFDPLTDPIVRVEAGRLRRALEHYYATDGRRDPLVIEMPRGSYVPVFRLKAAPRRGIARGHGLWRQIGETLHGNARLVLLIAVVATVISLGFDLLQVQLATAVSRPVLVVRQVAVQPPVPPEPVNFMVR
jgi:hypothetical protein